MSAIEDQIHDLLRRWVQAEPAGDIETLDALACEDFRLVGPAGFVLTSSSGLSGTAAARCTPRASVLTISTCASTKIRRS